MAAKTFDEKILSLSLNKCSICNNTKLVFTIKLEDVKNNNSTPTPICYPCFKELYNDTLSSTKPNLLTKLENELNSKLKEQDNITNSIDYIKQTINNITTSSPGK